MIMQFVISLYFGVRSLNMFNDVLGTLVYATCAFRFYEILDWVFADRFSNVHQACMRYALNV